MKAVIVYESMYGNTRKIAEAIGEGVGRAEDVVVVPAGHVFPEVLAHADLLVAGGRRTRGACLVRVPARPPLRTRTSPAVDWCSNRTRPALDCANGSVRSSICPAGPPRSTPACRPRVRSPDGPRPASSASCAAWLQAGGPTAELPRHQGQSARARRGNAGSGVGRATCRGDGVALTGSPPRRRAPRPADACVPAPMLLIHSCHVGHRPSSARQRDLRRDLPGATAAPPRSFGWPSSPAWTPGSTCSGPSASRSATLT